MLHLYGTAAAAAGTRAAAAAAAATTTTTSTTTTTTTSNTTGQFYKNVNADGSRASSSKEQVIAADTANENGINAQLDREVENVLPALCMY